jgi:two-component system, chemotaxis family, protein-glutamate methylesterase/glutaminase
MRKSPNPPPLSSNPGGPGVTPAPPSRGARARAITLVEALVIGASAGGPEALATLLPALGPLPVPIYVVQHMPAYFTRMFAVRLDQQCSFPVREAISGEGVEPGTAYLAPGDQHLELGRQAGRVKLRLSTGPLENACRPAVDPLFRSAAAVHGDRVLALVLTGMGKDGLHGSQAIKRAGGRVFVQDERTSIVWGMPGAVAKAGLADLVLPLGQLAPVVRKVLGVRTPPVAVSQGGE